MILITAIVWFRFGFCDSTHYMTWHFWLGRYIYIFYILYIFAIDFFFHINIINLFCCRHVTVHPLHVVSSVTLRDNNSSEVILKWRPQQKRLEIKYVTCLNFCSLNVYFLSPNDAFDKEYMFKTPRVHSLTVVKTLKWARLHRRDCATVWCFS